MRTYDGRTLQADARAARERCAREKRTAPQTIADLWQVESSLYPNRYRSESYPTVRRRVINACLRLQCMPEITKSPSNGSAPKTEPWHEDPGSFARFTDRLSPLPLADPSLKNSPVKRKRRFISRIRNL